MERVDKILDTFRWGQVRAAAKVPLICIYERPEDYPGKFVARLWDLQQPTSFLVVADTLEEIRKAIPSGMVPIQRDPTDAPAIVETWI